MGCIAPITNWSDYRALSLPAVASLLIVTLYILYKLNNRLLTFGGALLGGTSFLPASILLVTVGFTVVKRVLYLPPVGFCIMVGALYSWASRYYRNADKIGLAILVIAMTITYRRCEEWRTELDLYASGLKVCPENAKIHYNLGKLLRIGNVDAAEHNYWKNAICLNLNYEHVLNNLANILESKGRSGDAKHLLKQALRRRPTFAVAWMNLDITLMNQGKYQKSSATKSFKCYVSHANLGVLYQRWARYEEAEYYYRKALSLERNDAVEFNLEAVQEKLNRTSEDGQGGVFKPV